MTDGKPRRFAAHQHARRAIVGELGIEPGPGMRDFHERILAADPCLTITPRTPTTTDGTRITRAVPAVAPTASRRT